MARSRRKTPIFGITNARSEALDKRLWHQRWRSRERDQLATLGPDSDPLPIHHRAVSSPWDMAKDGKRWFAPERQKAVAQRIATRRSSSPAEHQAQKSRILAKMQAK